MYENIHKAINDLKNAINSKTIESIKYMNEISKGIKSLTQKIEAEARNPNTTTMQEYAKLERAYSSLQIEFNKVEDKVFNNAKKFKPDHQALIIDHYKKLSNDNQQLLGMQEKLRKRVNNPSKSTTNAKSTFIKDFSKKLVMFGEDIQKISAAKSQEEKNEIISRLEKTSLKDLEKMLIDEGKKIKEDAINGVHDKQRLENLQKCQKQLIIIANKLNMRSAELMDVNTMSNELSARIKSLNNLNQSILKEMDTMKKAFVSNLSQVKSSNMSKKDKEQMMRKLVSNSARSDEKLSNMVAEFRLMSQKLENDMNTKYKGTANLKHASAMQALSSNANQMEKAYDSLNKGMRDLIQYGGSLQQDMNKQMKKKQKVIMSMRVTGAVLTGGLSMLIELAVKGIMKRVKAKKAQKAMNNSQNASKVRIMMPRSESKNKSHVEREKSKKHSPSRRNSIAI